MHSYITIQAIPEILFRFEITLSAGYKIQIRARLVCCLAGPRQQILYKVTTQSGYLPETKIVWELYEVNR